MANHGFDLQPLGESPSRLTAATYEGIVSYQAELAGHHWPIEWVRRVAQLRDEYLEWRGALLDVILRMDQAAMSVENHAPVELGNALRSAAEDAVQAMLRARTFDSSDMEGVDA